jgi:hypothetical protein
MQKTIFLILLCSVAFGAQAQLKSNTPKYIVSFKQFAENNPDYFTDTLVFEMPNNSQVEAIFNPKDYLNEEVEEKMVNALKPAKNIKADEVRTYYLHPNWFENTLEEVIRDIYIQFTPHKVSYTMGFPFGLDYIGGKVAPEMGFRFVADFKRIGLGASITNSVFFSDKAEGGVNVFHNPFVNAEIVLSPSKTPWNTIQIGYLLRDAGPVFQGETFKLAYRYHIKGSIQLSAGMIFTDDVKTFIPMLGIRIL